MPLGEPSTKDSAAPKRNGPITANGRTSGCAQPRTSPCGPHHAAYYCTGLLYHSRRGHIMPVKGKIAAASLATSHPPPQNQEILPRLLQSFASVQHARTANGSWRVPCEVLPGRVSIGFGLGLGLGLWFRQHGPLFAGRYPSRRERGGAV